MPINTYRYNQYLDNYKFYSNCIDFRIKSSKALEKWKNVQSFQLNQLANGKFYFSADRREVLLLKYDIWTRWLHEVENLCLELGGKSKYVRSTQEDINHIIALGDKSVRKYRTIMLEENPSYFDKDFVETWLEQHECVNKYMIKRFKTYTDMMFSDVFVNIVYCLTEVMQYTLLEIHELDVLFGNQNSDSNDTDTLPFVSINNLVKTAYEKTGMCLITKRLKSYKKRFNIKEIYIKNYTDDHVCSDLVQRIKELGIEINFEKSLINHL